MTKDNQMSDNVIGLNGKPINPVGNPWGDVTVIYTSGKPPTDVSLQSKEYIFAEHDLYFRPYQAWVRADTIAAKDRALDVALEALKYAHENLSEIDGTDEITAKAIAQIEAVQK